MNDLLEFDSNIEFGILKAAQAVLDSRVKSFNRLQKGEVNFVYQVETEKETVIFRIFCLNKFSNFDDLKWVDNQLQRNHIRHPKILHLDHTSTFFHHGFMITEFIPGESCGDMIKNNLLSFEDYAEQVGGLLKKVHRISLKNFGDVNNGEGEYADFIEYHIHKLREKFEETKTATGFDDQVLLEIEKILRLLSRFMAKLRPVLTHGDPNRGNGIFTPEKQVVLVDWDNAKGSIWLKDLAYLTYHIDPHEKEKIKRIRESFLKGYGNIEFRPNEIEFISKILDVIKSLELLSYYLNVQKRRRSFDLTKGKLLELLSEF